MGVGWSALDVVSWCRLPTELIHTAVTPHPGDFKDQVHDELVGLHPVYICVCTGHVQGSVVPE